MIDFNTSSQQLVGIRLPVVTAGSSHDQEKDSGPPTLSDDTPIELSPTSPESAAGVSRHLVDGISGCIRKIVGFVEHEVHDESVQAILVTTVVNLIVISLLVADVRTSEF